MSASFLVANIDNRLNEAFAIRYLRAVAYRGSPAPGGQCLHRPHPELAPPLPHMPTRLAPSGLGARGAPPPPPFGKLVNPASATVLCNEVTLLICLGLVFFLQLGPTSWAGAPSKACARGSCPPCPPPRHATTSGILYPCEVFPSISPV